MSAFKMRWVYGIIMTEVIGIKFEETGAVEYVVLIKLCKDDFVVVLEKKDKRLAQVVMENTDFPEVSSPAVESGWKDWQERKISLDMMKIF